MKTISLGNLILPADRQVKTWRRAARRMHWPISDAEFKQIPSPPHLTEADLLDGFNGVIFNDFFDAIQIFAAMTPSDWVSVTWIEIILCLVFPSFVSEKSTLYGSSWHASILAPPDIVDLF